MKRMGRLFFVVSALLSTSLAAGCATESSAAKDSTETTEAQTTAPSPAASVPPPPSGPTREVRLLLTTDEHGWLLPLADDDKKLRLGGIVELFAQLTTERSVARRDVLLLSAGDNWTGPFESTVLEGASMVAAFNRMGYAASTIGNHEFDFGTEVLQTRANEAKFPFLAANVRESASGKIPAWAVPYTIVDTGEIKVGILGLTFAEAHTVTDAKNLVGLEFSPYEDALKEWVPRVRADGVDLVVVLLHDRMTEAQRLLPLLRRLGVTVVAAGHVHTAGLVIDDASTPEISDDVVICNAGAFMRSYCEINIALQGSAVTTLEAKVHRVKTALNEATHNADPELLKIVNAAQKNAERLGGEVLAYAPKKIRRQKDALGQVIVDSWLRALPYVDVAVTNRGGLRQDLRRGKVRVRDIRSVLPFNNTLVVVEMSGAQLREMLANPAGIVSGVKFSYQVSTEGVRIIRTLTDLEGKPIANNARLKVVVNDFMYRGGDNFLLRSVDREPEETALDWREPLLRHLRSLTAEKKKLVHVADDRALQVNR